MLGYQHKAFSLPREGKLWKAKMEEMSLQSNIKIRRRVIIEIDGGYAVEVRYKF